VILTVGCAGSRSSASGNNEIFGRGLSACAEQCRPFGVLSFGFNVLPDGSPGFQCECMPGPTPEEEEPEEEGDDQPEDERREIVEPSVPREPPWTPDLPPPPGMRAWVE
jgi:hypothetical protein